MKDSGCPFLCEKPKSGVCVCGGCVTCASVVLSCLSEGQSCCLCRLFEAGPSAAGTRWGDACCFLRAFLQVAPKLVVTCQSHRVW